MSNFDFEILQIGLNYTYSFYQFGQLFTPNSSAIPNFLNHYNHNLKLESKGQNKI